VPLDRPVTIRHLFAHTAGFSYGGFLSDDERLGRSYSQARVQSRDVTTLAEQVKRLGRTVLAHQPGEGWTYGMSHDVLARVIEVVSGQGIDQYLKQQIFDPLDMRDTSFLVPEEKRERVATIYRQSGAAGLLPLPRSFGSETLFGGGAGLFSTARDYARFCQMLLNGGELDGAKILRPESIRQMTAPQVTGRAAFGASYGLGFGLDLRAAAGAEPAVLERYYWSGLFSTSFWVDPRHELAGVLMMQLLPSGQAGADRVFRETVEAAIEPATRTP
jgi:CubicO group peptidase (beta-lactamase class C family)